jgi:hypothetical protein
MKKSLMTAFLCDDSALLVVAISTVNHRRFPDLAAEKV